MQIVTFVLWSELFIGHQAPKSECVSTKVFSHCFPQRPCDARAGRLHWTLRIRRLEAFDSKGALDIL